MHGFELKEVALLREAEAKGDLFVLTSSKSATTAAPAPEENRPGRQFPLAHSHQGIQAFRSPRVNNLHLRDVHISSIMNLVMKTITVELTPEMAEQMIPLWEKQRDKKLAEARELDAKIKQVREDLDTTTPSGVPDGIPTRVAPPPKTPHGRNKRGASRTLISQFLKMRNGNGATIKEVTADTGTVYGTARRILKDLEKESKASVKDGLWKWNT